MNVVTILPNDGEEHVVGHVSLQGQVGEGVAVKDDTVHGAAVRQLFGHDKLFQVETLFTDYLPKCATSFLKRNFSDCMKLNEP